MKIHCFNVQSKIALKAIEWNPGRWATPPPVPDGSWCEHFDAGLSCAWACEPESSGFRFWIVRGSKTLKTGLRGSSNSSAGVALGKDARFMYVSLTRQLEAWSPEDVVEAETDPDSSLYREIDEENPPDTGEIWRVDAVSGEAFRMYRGRREEVPGGVAEIAGGLLAWNVDERIRLIDAGGKVVIDDIGLPVRYGTIGALEGGRVILAYSLAAAHAPVEMWLLADVAGELRALGALAMTANLRHTDDGQLFLENTKGTWSIIGLESALADLAAYPARGKESGPAFFERLRRQVQRSTPLK